MRQGTMETGNAYRILVGEPHEDVEIKSEVSSALLS